MEEIVKIIKPSNINDQMKGSVYRAGNLRMVDIRINT